MVLENIDFTNYGTVKVLLLGKKDMLDFLDLNGHDGNIMDINSLNNNHDYTESVFVKDSILEVYDSIQYIIDECKFTKKQLKLLNLIFKGNTVATICASDSNYEMSATSKLFKRVILIITEKAVELQFIKKG